MNLVEVIESGGFLGQKRKALIDEAKIAPYLKRDVIFAPPKKKRKAETANDGEGGGKPKNDGV